MHSETVCADFVTHSANSANESAATLIANAAPIIDINTIGSFHFIHVISHLISFNHSAKTQALRLSCGQ